MNSGNVIALAMPYNAYAIRQQWLRSAFEAALGAVLGAEMYAVRCTDFGVSQVGGVLVYCDVAV